MIFSQVSYIKVGKGKSGDKRLWMEGKRMAFSGFEKGKQYKTLLNVQSRSIDLVLDDKGDKKVSGRQRYGKVNPIIDLCSSSITHYVDEVLGGVDRVRVVFMRHRIRISVHHQDQLRLDREAQTRTNLVQGILSEATLCVGGGISSWALHQGFEDVGLHAISEFVVDMEGKYLQNAMDNNPYITDDTVIYEASLEEMEPQLVKESMRQNSLDVLNVSLPCTGHSKAGKSKNKITHAEEHSSAGTSIVGLLNIIQASNPTCVISENVPEFKNSATKALLEGFLSKCGYVVCEGILGRELGAFEDRDRHFMVAISKGLAKGFDLKEIEPSALPPATLAEILEDIPEDSPMWKSYDYLAAKEVRDIAAGKSYRRQLVRPDTAKIGSIGKGYNRGRSTEPFLIHPTDPDKSRLLTVGEHASAKGIPQDAVAGRSVTQAHEILGQSVLFPGVRSLGRLIGAHLKETILDVPQNQKLVEQLENAVIQSKWSRESSLGDNESSAQQLQFYEQLQQLAVEIRTLHQSEEEDCGAHPG